MSWWSDQYAYDFPEACELTPELAEVASVLGFAVAVPAETRTPSERLWLAVLGEAIRTVRRGGGTAAEAARWIASDDRESPISFLDVCEVAGLDPARVRRAVRDRPRRRAAYEEVQWRVVEIEPSRLRALPRRASSG